MLTEHEAKQRWCPFARVGVTEAVGSHACNRTPLSGIEGLNGANLCIGSACMAWRNAETRQEGDTFVPEMQLYTDAMMFPTGVIVERTDQNVRVVSAMKAWGERNEAEGHVPKHDSPKCAGVPILWIEREVSAGYCGLAGAPQ